MRADEEEARTLPARVQRAWAPPVRVSPAPTSPIARPIKQITLRRKSKAIESIGMC
jgi:hypothetical protein